MGDPERLEALKAAFSALAALEGSVEALDVRVAQGHRPEAIRGEPPRQ
ncbi:MAG: hypothetical protein R3F43_03050 [bacterium]